MRHAHLYFYFKERTMTLIEFVLLLLVAGIIGALGQALGGYSAPGCAMSIVIGFVGAFIGRWLQHLLGLPTWLTVDLGNHVKFPVIWSVIGAALLVVILRLIMGRRVVSG
jgi:uncharacterized membrane protein YeaQ/YmgE (transglycosylase-associated protein family)